MLQQVPGLHYRPSDIHGWGVFCTHNLLQGDVIEICPMIILKSGSIRKEDTLYQYYFIWENNRKAIALGYGSLYNHSSSANADFTPDYNDNTLILTAVSDIPSGTEITINYHAGNREAALWFEDFNNKYD